MQENITTTEAEVTTEASVFETEQPKEESAPVVQNKHEEPGYWKLQGKRFKKYRHVLWFIIPAAAFSLFFSYVPMLGLFFAFKPAFNIKYGLLTNLFSVAQVPVTENGVQVGTKSVFFTFQNFIDIFVDNGKFFLSVGNTLVINIIKLIICFPLSILIAVQLAGLKNQGLAKTILIIICIPNFLSWAIVISTWGGMVEEETGILREFFAALAGVTDSSTVMGNDGLFKFFTIFLSGWKGVGWGCILYYAAIAAIDKSFYEAATLEGANRLQKAWYLTVPMISATIALNLVLTFSGMMAAGFEEIYTLMSYNMGTLKETQPTLDTYIYEISILDKTNVPMATALGVFNGLIALALMIVGNKITTKTLHRSLW